MVTSHSAALSGLTPDTTYHYRVKSRDAAGNLGTSGDFTFSTAHTSLSLNGSTAYAEVPNDSSLNITSDWTVELWFKDASSSYNHDFAVLFTKGEVPLSSGGDNEVPFFASIGFNVLYVGERTNSANQVISYNLSSGDEREHLASSGDHHEGFDTPDHNLH